MQFPVYLVRSTHKDQGGNIVSIAERRLVPKSAEDRVIAIVNAPPGTRIRRKRDEHGPDQLVVPLGGWPWSRFFGIRVIIPTKYLIGDARRRAHGLSLVPTYSEAVTG